LFLFLHKASAVQAANNPFRVAVISTKKPQNLLMVSETYRVFTLGQHKRHFVPSPPRSDPPIKLFL
jgi:hypothetical protein